MHVRRGRIDKTSDESAETNKFVHVHLHVHTYSYVCPQYGWHVWSVILQTWLAICANRTTSLGNVTEPDAGESHHVSSQLRPTTTGVLRATSPVGLRRTRAGFRIRLPPGPVRDDSQLILVPAMSSYSRYSYLFLSFLGCFIFLPLFFLALVWQAALGAKSSIITPFHWFLKYNRVQSTPYSVEQIDKIPPAENPMHWSKSSWSTSLTFLFA